MSILKTTLTLALALIALALAVVTPAAMAGPSRELVTSFGQLNEPDGIAVDLETGNVYVAEPQAQTVDIYNATGGPPAGGVPTQITGLHMERFSTGIAVDNSCYEHQPRLTGQACEEYDPSYGDVYVVDDAFGEYGVNVFKLNADNYEEVQEIKSPLIEDGPGGIRFHSIRCTVDSQGDLYMVGYPLPETILELKSGGGALLEISQKISAQKANLGARLGNVAVDDAGDLYTSAVLEAVGNGDQGVVRSKIGAAGKVLSEEVFAAPLPKVETPRPIAVDRTTGDVYVGNGSSIAEYDGAGMLQSEFGSSEPAGGSLKGDRAVIDIAVNGATGDVYVANTSLGDVDVFGPIVALPVIPESQPEASDQQRTSVLLAGSADPEGGGGSYYFQYVPAAELEPGAADPYAAGVQTATATLPGRHADESIERVVLSGLKPGTTYHYRLVVSNATGTSYGPDEAFTTAPATPPAVATGAAVEVSATAATLTGTVGPRGLPTSYVFEVGTDTGYGGAKLFGNAGEGTGEEQVSVALRFLIPGTTYHYRLVASSFDGTTYGQDETFTTPGVPSPVTQPPGTPLLASSTGVFPSIAGAVTWHAGATKPRRALTGTQKLEAALRACRKERPAKRRAGCEERARKAHPQTKTNDPKKKR